MFAGNVSCYSNAMTSMSYCSKRQGPTDRPELWVLTSSDP